MGCGCNKNRENRVAGQTTPAPETFEVVASNGKVVFKHTNVETAKAIANRYEDSNVRELSSGRIVHKSIKASATAAGKVTT